MHPRRESTYSDGVRSRNGKGFAAVEGGVVGWVNGGEPVLGCEVVSLLIFAPTKADVKVRARKIGIQGGCLMDRFGDLDPEGVTAAVTDPRGFVWNDGQSDEWWPSADLVRRQP